MPEQLLARIIRVCSEPDALVMDPFSGSGSTVTVARKLGRRYLGFDLSPQYVTLGLQRLESVSPGDRLVGAEEPLMSAPQTWQGKNRTRTGPAGEEKAKGKSPAGRRRSKTLWKDA